MRATLIRVNCDLAMTAGGVVPSLPGDVAGPLKGHTSRKVVEITDVPDDATDDRVRELYRDTAIVSGFGDSPERYSFRFSELGKGRIVGTTPRKATGKNLRV